MPAPLGNWCMLGSPRPTCGGDGGSGELPCRRVVEGGSAVYWLPVVDWTDSQALVISQILGSNCGLSRAIVVEAAYKC